MRNFSSARSFNKLPLACPKSNSKICGTARRAENARRSVPRGVEQIEVGVAIRRIATQYGVFPGAVRAVRAAAGSLAAEGNPLNEERGKRDAWAAGLPVKPFEEGMEVLYFVGCYYSYDPRLRKVAAATAEILDKAGVDFGILGNRESCCGESIRKTGNEEVFKTRSGEHQDLRRTWGEEILVSSPHCYHTLKNEYPEFMVNFEVVHISRLPRTVDRGGTAHPQQRSLQEGHLPRPMLPGTTQRDLRRTPGGLEEVARTGDQRNGRFPRRQPVLRRRRRPDLGGNAEAGEVCRPQVGAGAGGRGGGAGYVVPVLHCQFRGEPAVPGGWRRAGNQGPYGTRPGIACRK